MAFYKRPYLSSIISPVPVDSWKLTIPIISHTILWIPHLIHCLCCYSKVYRFKNTWISLLKVFVVCVHRAVLQRRRCHLERAFLSSTERRLPWRGDGGADAGRAVQLQPVRHTVADMTHMFINKLIPLFSGCEDANIFSWSAAGCWKDEWCSGSRWSLVCYLVFSFHVVLFAVCLLLFVFALLQRLQFEHELAAWWRWASVLQTGTPAGE